MEKEKLFREMSQLFRARDKSKINTSGESEAGESILLAERAYINFQLNRFNDALKDADLSLAITENGDPCAHYVKAAALLELYEETWEVVDHLKLFLEFSPINADFNEARRYIEKAESKLQQRAINRLPDEMLIKIFQCLPFRERMRAEIVCRRWNALVKCYGWSNFRCFISHRYLSVTQYKSKYLPLFKRCAPYLYGLSLTQVGICSSLLNRLLPTLVNLRHLNLDSMGLNSATLVSIAKALPHLKSVAFSELDSEASQGFQFFMKTCTKLELLCLHGENDFSDFEFAVLSPSLKCLDVYSFVPYHIVLHQVALQEISLEALVIRNDDDGSPTVPEATFHVTSLKYLQVDVYADSVHNFVSALTGLSNLHALDLEVGEDVSDQMTFQIVDGIAKKCKRLQHLSIKFFKTQYGEDLFDLMAEELTNIKSLTIMGAFEDNKLACLFQSGAVTSNAVARLLERISSYGRLEHFYTDAYIPLEGLFTTILRCEKLSSFGGANLEDDLMVKIVEFLDYQGDGRVELAKLSELSPSSFMENPIRQQYRTGCLSAGKPKFFH